MDLKKLMQMLHYGAQHMTAAELKFFGPVYKAFEQSHNVAQSHLPILIDLYKRLAFRQTDVAALIAELQSSVLLLADDEQTLVEAASMTFELSSTLDPAYVQKLLQIRSALHARQHSTLVRRDEPLSGCAIERPQQQKSTPVPQTAAGKRPSARRLPNSAALDAAAKLLKRG